MVTAVMTMWREKYRPTSLAEIEGQDDVIDRLKSFAVHKQLPNLLLGLKRCGQDLFCISLSSGTLWLA